MDTDNITGLIKFRKLALNIFFVIGLCVFAVLAIAEMGYLPYYPSYDVDFIFFFIDMGKEKWIFDMIIWCLLYCVPPLYMFMVKLEGEEQGSRSINMSSVRKCSNILSVSLCISCGYLTRTAVKGIMRGDAMIVYAVLLVAAILIMCIEFHYIVLMSSVVLDREIDKSE